MENLLCDEAWLSSPVAPIDHQSSECYRGSFYPTKEDSEEALSIYMEKEISYMPEANYVEHLRSQNLTNARYRATRWLFRVSFSILDRQSFFTSSSFNFFLDRSPTLVYKCLVGFLFTVQKSLESLFWSCFQCCKLPWSVHIYESMQCKQAWISNIDYLLDRIIYMRIFSTNV